MLFSIALCLFLSIWYQSTAMMVGKRSKEMLGAIKEQVRAMDQQVNTIHSDIDEIFGMLSTLTNKMEQWFVQWPGKEHLNASLESIDRRGHVNAETTAHSRLLWRSSILSIGDANF